MALIRLNPQSKKTLLELKDELGEPTQSGTLEKILKEFKEMKTKYKALYWVNELNKANNAKNAIEI